MTNINLSSPFYIKAISQNPPFFIFMYLGNKNISSEYAIRIAALEDKHYERALKLLKTGLSINKVIEFAKLDDNEFPKDKTVGDLDEYISKMAL